MVEQIRGAPLRETAEQVADRLGISIPTVKKYRRAAKADRQEAAREVIARHVEENIPDALSDLTELRRASRERYEKTGDARQGTLWLGAIKTTLEHVQSDDADLDAAIERELAHVAGAGEEEVSREAPAAPPAVN